VALGRLKRSPNVKPLRVFPNVMMLRKGDERFRATINIALHEIINGFVERVIGR
jgi:hypothetical protein